MAIIFRLMMCLKRLNPGVLLAIGVLSLTFATACKPKTQESTKYESSNSDTQNLSVVRRMVINPSTYQGAQKVSQVVTNNLYRAEGYLAKLFLGPWNGWKVIRADLPFEARFAGDIDYGFIDMTTKRYKDVYFQYLDESLVFMNGKPYLKFDFSKSAVKPWNDGQWLYTIERSGPNRHRVRITPSIVRTRWNFNATNVDKRLIVIHPQLAASKTAQRADEISVNGAGEFYLHDDGSFAVFNDSSGHFRPEGKFYMKYLEGILSSHGINNVALNHRF